MAKCCKSKDQTIYERVDYRIQKQLRDLNKYRHDTNIRLIVGALILIFLLGDGLVFVIYGAGPGLIGLTCLLISLVPLLLVALIIFILDWSVKRANRG